MKRILIIDDDEIFEFITRELVIELYPEADVKSFLSSTEGLEYLQSALTSGSQIPDILLLDIRMPVMDGFELLDELAKSHGQTGISPLRIYMLTSSLDAKDYRMSTENPLVSGFISKPLEADKLKSIME
ncbi:MAG: response regulator [Bacteroidota bacterium]